MDKTKLSKRFKIFCALVLALSMMLSTASIAYATGGDPLTVINNLSTFIFGLIRAVGIILLGWALFRWVFLFNRMTLLRDPTDFSLLPAVL